MRQLLILLIMLPLCGRAQVSFLRTYGDVSFEGAHCGMQTADGGYLLAGTSSSDGYTIIKTNSIGDTLWTTGIPGVRFYGAVQVADGYVFTGTPGICLIKTDLSGHVKWTISFSTNTNDAGYSVYATADSGFVITGQKNYNTITFTGDICLIHTDTAGNQQWLKLLSTGLIDCAGRSVQQTTDGGYIVCGHSYSMLGPGSGYDQCLIKTNSAGIKQWSKYFGSPPALGEPDRAYSVKQTTDGGYIVAGSYSESLTHQAYLVKTNATGDTLWTKTYGTSSQGFTFKSVWQTTDGGYVAAGSASTDLVVVKTNSAGDTLWTKIIDGTDDTQAESIMQTTDGGYAVIGFTAAPEFSDSMLLTYQHLLVKMDSTGDYTTHIPNEVTDHHAPANDILVYPNPADKEVTIRNNCSEPVRFRLYNQPGIRIINRTIPAGAQTTIDISYLAPGHYIYAIFSGKEKVGYGKIFKQ